MKNLIVLFVICHFSVTHCVCQRLVKNDVTLKGMYLEIRDVSPNCDRCHATKYITTDSTANYDYDFRSWVILTNQKTLIQLASFFYQNDNGKKDLEKDATVNAYEINIKEGNNRLLYYTFSNSSDSRTFFSHAIAFMKQNNLDKNIIAIFQSFYKQINWSVLK